MPTIDLGVKISEDLFKFPIIVPGTHLCTITGIEAKESKEVNQKMGKKLPLLVVKFTPVGSVNCFKGEEQVQIEGQELITSYLVTCPVIGKDGKTYPPSSMVGLVLASGVQYSGSEFDYNELIGKQVKVETTVTDDGKGNKRVEVEHFYKA